MLFLYIEICYKKVCKQVYVWEWKAYCSFYSGIHETLNLQSIIVQGKYLFMHELRVWVYIVNYIIIIYFFGNKVIIIINVKLINAFTYVYMSMNS